MDVVISHELRQALDHAIAEERAARVVYNGAWRADPGDYRAIDKALGKLEAAEAEVARLRALIAEAPAARAA